MYHCSFVIAQNTHAETGTGQKDDSRRDAEAPRMTASKRGTIVADAAIVVHRARGAGLLETFYEKIIRFGEGRNYALCERLRRMISSLRLSASAGEHIRIPNFARNGVKGPGGFGMSAAWQTC